MATLQLKAAVAGVIIEIIKVKRRLYEEEDREERQKRICWVREWIKRREELGASNRLLKELVVEDPKSFFNFLRMNEELFSTLLNKVGNFFINCTISLFTIAFDLVKHQLNFSSCNKTGGKQHSKKGYMHENGTASKTEIRNCMSLPCYW